MNADGPVVTDTRDMFSIHEAFRRGLGEAPGQIASVKDGDVERAGRLASYLSELLWLLGAHHEGEDELLYPLLVERLPEKRELFSRMDSQHGEAKATLAGAEEAVRRFGETASSADGEAAAAACRALLETLEPHLAEEEIEVLPLAGQSVTPVEWGALPGHALGQYSGERIWLPFGLAFEAMPDDLREAMFKELPPPVLEMWTGGGSAAFDAEMASLRSALG